MPLPLRPHQPPRPPQPLRRPRRPTLKPGNAATRTPGSTFGPVPAARRRLSASFSRVKASRSIRCERGGTRYWPMAGRVAMWTETWWTAIVLLPIPDRAGHESGVASHKSHPSPSVIARTSRKEGASGQPSAVLLEQRPEHGAMTARLVGTIAADREIGVVREGSQQFE
jgi:hypothetical protein